MTDQTDRKLAVSPAGAAEMASVSERAPLFVVIPPLVRFHRFTMTEPNSGCVLWLGRLSQAGYGKFTPHPGQTVFAHRFAYETFTAPIPAGLVIDHLCRNRACVNPTHLEPVTQRVNVLRGKGLSAQRAAMTHCIAGHPFDESNTYWATPTKRHCRACTAKRAMRRYYADIEAGRARLRAQRMKRGRG